MSEDSSANAEVEVKGVNDLFMNLEYMVYQLKYDSVHVRSSGSVAAKKDGDKEILVVNGKDVAVFHDKDPASIPWVLATRTSSTSLRAYSPLRRRRSCTSRAVAIMSSSLRPPKDAALIYVVGVNHKDYKKTDTVVSNAPLTTNCLAPLTKVVNDKFGSSRA